AGARARGAGHRAGRRGDRSGAAAGRARGRAGHGFRARLPAVPVAAAESGGMSWWAVAALCGAAYALKLAGVALAGRAQRADALPLELVVVPVLAALILVQTIGG